MPEETSSLLSGAKTSGVTKSSGAATATATPSNPQELTDLAALQEKCTVLAEVFENQRFSPELKKGRWGSSFPGHFQPADPRPWTNRLHQLASAVRTREEVTPPEGWEYLGEWQLDTTHTECDAEEGWSYGNDFPQLQLLLLELRLGPTAGTTSAKAGGGSRARTEPVAVHVRWRRWVRLRRLIPGAVAPERLFQVTPGGSGGGAVSEYDSGIVPESAVQPVERAVFAGPPRASPARWGSVLGLWIALSALGRSASVGRSDPTEGLRCRQDGEVSPLNPQAVLCEGWLARMKQGRWVQHWVVLVRNKDGGGVTLLYCDSREAQLVRDARTSPPASLRTYAAPRPNQVGGKREGKLGARCRRCCFGLGQEGAGGTLHRANSPSDMRRWRDRIAAVLVAPRSDVPAPPLPPPSDDKDDEESRASNDGSVSVSGSEQSSLRSMATREMADPPAPSISSKKGGSFLLCARASKLPRRPVVAKAGRLTVEIVSASGLAAADSNATSDPYARLTVKADTQTHSEKTRVVHNTLAPHWGERWSFDDVWSGQTEVPRHAHACMCIVHLHACYARVLTPCVHICCTYYVPRWCSWSRTTTSSRSVESPSARSTSSSIPLSWTSRPMVRWCRRP